MKYRLDKKYNSLDRLEAWDENSRKVVKDRINREKGEEMKFTFLTKKEGATLKIITDILIDQSQKKSYIKIAEAIDVSLSLKKEGVRYGENPWKGRFYKEGLGIAGTLFATAKNNKTKQTIICETLGKKTGCFIERFLKEVLRDAIVIYYSHPRAWNEVGFPGPAYPEGYYALRCGEADSWEPQYELVKNNGAKIH